MEDKSQYQIFLEKLSQLQQDQSLYEAEIQNSDELQGLQHEEVIKLGRLMCKRFQRFAEKGQEFADTLPPDFVPKLSEAMNLYQTLIVPPKIFGGFCPCLKQARNGPEYDKKLSLTKARMVTACFTSQAVLIEQKAEQHNVEGVQSADYVSKMNLVFKALDDIKVGNSEKAQELSRKKLLQVTEQVDRFVQLFGDFGGKKEFRVEATRIVKRTQENLQTRPTASDGTPLPLGKRLLIKGQSSLQEIMNSAAAISLTSAKENLKNLESLSKLLHKTRELEVAQFNQMEEMMLQLNLQDDLARMREECDVLFTEATIRLKDATKRWTAVKSQSIPRKVVEYDDEGSSMTTGATTGVGGAMNAVTRDIASALNVKPLPPMKPVDLDPSGLFKKIADGAKDAAAKVKDGAHKVFQIENSDDMPTNAPPPPPKPNRKSTGQGNNSQNSTGGNRSAVSSPAVPRQNSRNTASTAGTGSGSGTQSPSPRPTSMNKGKSNMFNPLESLLGGDDA
jgi:hypothetical protein